MANYANFQVSLKAIIKYEQNILVLRTPSGYVDFPGGRIDTSELELPSEIALARELREELGEKIQFTVGNVLFVSRRDYSHTGAKEYIIAVYYAVILQNVSDIALSEEHDTYEWMSISDLLALRDKFMSDDEFIQFSKFYRIN